MMPWETPVVVDMSQFPADGPDPHIWVLGARMVEILEGLEDAFGTGVGEGAELLRIRIVRDPQEGPMPLRIVRAEGGEVEMGWGESCPEALAEDPGYVDLLMGELLAGTFPEAKGEAVFRAWSRACGP